MATQTNLYNPNTGALLKPGESVVNQQTGQTVTQGTPYVPYVAPTASTPATVAPTASQTPNYSAISQQLSGIQQQANTIATQIPATQSAQPTQQSIYAPAASYTGTSIVDFLTQAGQASDYASRAALATKYGITGYTGTAAQNTQLLGILKSMGAGNTNSVGVPNNISTINNVGTAVTPSTPISATSLSSTGNFNTDLNSILRAGSSATSSIDSQIAGLINLWNTSSSQQTQMNQEQSQLAKLSASLGDNSLQSALDQSGYTAANAQFKEASLNVANLQGQIASFDAETQKGLSNTENQAIPAGLVQGQQAQYQKQRDLTKLGMTAQLAGATAIAQAYQGNVTNALNLAQMSVDTTFKIQEAQIDAVKTQISITQDSMNAEDNKKANIINALLKIKEDELAQAKDQASQVQKLAITAASNGAPLSVTQAMSKSTDPVAAAQLGGQYLNTPASPKIIGSASSGYYQVNADGTTTPLGVGG